MIRAIGLHKAFSGQPVLNGVDVHVREGHVLGIIGPGGVGKSLLLKMMCGLVRPDEGRIEVDGRDIATLSSREMGRLRERFGLLFQNYALFDFMNVGQNVGFPLEQRGVAADEIQQRVAERLADVELPGVEPLFANELSGGMKKRVALARATIASAPILFYDDPTAGLDPVTSSKIFRLIERLHSPGGATVICGHDVDRMTAVCDEWVLLNEGRVHFRGDTGQATASDDPVVRTFFESAPAVLGVS